EAICEEFSSKYGSVCKAVQANLETPRPAAQKIVSEAKRLFANKDGQLRIDILINNAGIGGNYVIGEIPEEAFHKQYAVNVLAPLMLTQECKPYLPNDRSGRIVNLSSVSSSLGFVGQTIYAGPKRAP